MTDQAEKWQPDEFSGEIQQAPSCALVLFGCTGDLAKRKIAPALYNLLQERLLTDRVAVVGIGRRDWTDETLREHFREAMGEFSRTAPEPALLDGLLERTFYQRVNVGAPADYTALAERLGELDASFGTGGNRLIYVSMGPEFFKPVAENLAAAGLNRPAGDGEFARLVVEKPFGHDLSEAKQLNRDLREHFDEEQICRIDHYLGKETVQNLLVLRFANSLFEPHLNRDHVESIQITAAETVGMEGRRGAYYETSGALRDMIQNHLLQVLALVTMDRPSCQRCEAVRDAKAELLRCVQPFNDVQVSRGTLRGQYEGYRDEEGVSADSQVETYAAIHARIDNDRWRGVPMLLRTGKKLAAKTTQIVVTFRRSAHELFVHEGCDLRGTNSLVVRITPNEGVLVGFDAKVPGQGMLLRPVKMQFLYESAFASASPEAYEHLLLDAMRGDSTLFIRGDETEAAWAVVDSIRQGWLAGLDGGVKPYAPGSWGPAQARELLDDPYADWYPLWM
jgi:glucose-6-phosphate 1-dehydrogenase